ncbi:hypothetical protein CFR77_15525 [Komagataeibacter sucrofermentans]|uniref:Insertion element IS402-like domain-containing protein n=1 Tax=Komagataeibacter sucrofermentans TaxID=1053551 RepID=A0A318QJ54_9PROT|nr:hypothetical protein CFR77_15525 [Komagataeibacter sucrofermentans]GBQ52786.1 transposase [Komagataeibacter sucrofermentans DSM 15973]
MLAAAIQTLGPIDIQDFLFAERMFHRSPCQGTECEIKIKRYELSEAQWQRIAPLRPGKGGDAGCCETDNRLFVHGCLWILRSGVHWKDLPERYGKWKTVHRRFSRWNHAGVWDRIFEMRTTDRNNQYLMFDSAIVRVHLQAANGKGGARTRR